MVELGWKRTRLRFAGKPEHCYVRGNAKFAVEITVYRDTSGQWHVRNHEGVAPGAAAKIEWLKVQMAEALAEAEFEAEEAAQGGQNEMPV